MERVRDLYKNIISVDNLNLADEKAREDKEKTYGVILHDKNRESNILKLHEQLEDRSYKTSAYKIFTIYENKPRIIYQLPYYPDRIMHHAIMNVFEQIWVPIFTADTYSCIKGRGIMGAARKVKKAIRDCDNACYCLKIDVKKFYPSIDHDVLKRIVRQKVKCEDTLALLDEIINSADGVPIGNYLSQYFANLILAYFDHVIKEVKKVKYYFRYADDMVFFSDNKEDLHSLLCDIKEYLRCEVSLELKENFQVFPLVENHQQRHGRGLDFVGFVFYHKETRMRKSIKQSMCRKVAKLNKIDGITYQEYIKGIAGWLGWAKHSDSDYLLWRILKPEFYERIVKKLKKRPYTKEEIEMFNEKIKLNLKTKLK